MSSDPTSSPSPQNSGLPHPSKEPLLPPSAESDTTDLQKPLSPTEVRALEALLDVLPADIEEIPIALAADRKPQPGFWFSALACVVFLIVLYGTLFIIAFAVLIGNAVTSGDPNHYFSTIQQGSETNQKEKDGANDQEGFPRTDWTPDLIASVAYGMLGAEFVSILFAWLVVRLMVGREWPRRLALRRPGGVHTVLVVLSWPALLIVPGPIAELARHILPSMVLGDKTQGVDQLLSRFPLWLSILAIGVGPGLGEELWCRGFLGRGLVARYGPVVGILLTSLFFGLLHLDPAYAMVTACMGIWLHYVYWMTRSLWLSMLLHFLNNSTGVLLSHFAANDPSEQAPVIMPIAAAILMAAVGWALYTSRARLAPVPGSTGIPWRPAYPGAEYPPKGSAVRMVKPWPDPLAATAVLLSLVLFFAVAYSINR